MRLSGFERFFAKNFLGGKIFKAAAWDSAVVYMDKAIGISPENIYHHLDLAEILIDRERYSEARIHLQQVESLPVYDVMDPTYQERAVSCSARSRARKTRTVEAAYPSQPVLELFKALHQPAAEGFLLRLDRSPRVLAGRDPGIRRLSRDRPGLAPDKTPGVTAGRGGKQKSDPGTDRRAERDPGQKACGIPVPPRFEVRIRGLVLEFIRFIHHLCLLKMPEGRYPVLTLLRHAATIRHPQQAAHDRATRVA